MDCTRGKRPMAAAGIGPHCASELEPTSAERTANWAARIEFSHGRVPHRYWWPGESEPNNLGHCTTSKCHAIVFFPASWPQPTLRRLLCDD